MINAKSGDVILIPAGTLEMESSLILDGIDNITIKGAGIDKTILTFKNQKEGAEGLKVKSNHVLIEGMTLQDMKGDGIKVWESEDVTFRNLKIEWTRGPDTANGSYGLYPVKCNRVLIEYCFVSGASDAGIYVGQSNDCIIRKNECTLSVQGIEAENCNDVLIFDNKAWGNTSGISVNNLPDLPTKNGKNTRVYNNELKDNNLANFGAPGATVYIIPAGTGLFILSGNNVEVFSNHFENHRTTGLGIISFPITGRPMNDSLFDPFSRGIYVHDNTFIHHAGVLPDTSRQLGALMAKLFQTDVPEIIFDGLYDPKILAGGRGAIPPAERICIRKNGDARVATLDAGNEFKNLTIDATMLDCELNISVKTQHP